MDYHALLKQVRDTLPAGRILIGESQCTSNPAPRELFDALERVSEPLTFPSQAHIVVEFRRQCGKTCYRAEVTAD